MSYSQVVDHRRMVFDAHRNAAYLEAIRNAISAGAKVLDLGAGLGLHGLMAARAGAGKVYLVEPAAVVSAAEDAARAALLTDRVVILRDRIENVQLPEPVDLIVSALTGNLLFSEDLLPSLYHARDRYLAPGGRMLPDRAQLWLAPWTAQLLHQDHVARWKEPLSGFDYRVAARCASNSIIWPSREDLADTAALSEGACLVDLDLTATHAVECDAEATIPVREPGHCHGLLAWLRLRIGERWISAHPGEAAIHWSPALLPLDPPLEVRPGDSMGVSLRHARAGDWTWSASIGSQSRRHSTFLARLESPSELARAAPQWSGHLGPAGERTVAALQMLGQGRTALEVALELGERFGIDSTIAQREVARLAIKYGNGK
jgi:SAM-dependent methyltransferase